MGWLDCQSGDFGFPQETVLRNIDAAISAAEADEAYQCFDTEDFREGYAAFLAKTKPVFKGR